ncbi:MAG: aminotransferase class I/II-fold pyridoxal phosphate-dependent enzyme [Peptococcaceae bacterium]|jgi:histidinol-phosphate aminotransferase|nr:aminotransferase class I/II-fold pyridoxal phosphate-dependent enzyme [Peptococcaceae bacterium]MDH7523844.1 aminotransferase class I/II-fold pyridoxal phosphate-dependent enzyme [Peptococcaceae bacterium]
MKLRIKQHLSKYQRDTYTSQDSLRLEKGKPYLDCALGTNPYGCPRILLDDPPLPDKDTIVNYPQANKAFIKEIICYWREITTLKETNIRLEAGTFGAIERLNKLFVNEQSLVLGYCPQFSDYMQDVLCCGGTFKYVELKREENYRFNAGDILSAIGPEYDFIYIDNPNNPTGQVIPLPEIERVVKKAEELGIAVLIDEAYGDFMDKGNSAIALATVYQNLFVARSFTKGFGLAGLRVGYVVMSEQLEPLFSKVAHPFPVNAPAQTYARLALQDSGFLDYCKTKFRACKNSIMASCSRLWIPETEPATPIMTLIHPNPEIDLFAEFLNRYVITTPGYHFPGLGKNSVRLRIPKEQEQITSIVQQIDAL